MTLNSSPHSTTTLCPERTARRVVLAGRFKFGLKAAEQFRKLGWEVFTAATDNDVHLAIAEADPHAILLSEDAGGESGYLICAKLRLTQPDLKLILVGRKRTPECEQFAEFVGASFVTESDGVTELVAAAE